MGHVDETPSPTFAERLFTRAYATNPEYTAWAKEHNAANAGDRSAFDAAVSAAHATGAAESRTDARAAAGDPSARHDVQLRDVNETNLNKNLPPNATKMGTLEDTGTPGGSPIRDINSVTIDGKSWGYVYRTADGTLMLQRDSASVPTSSHTSSWGVGGSAGASKDPFALQVNGSYSYATTITDPTQQAIAKLTDIDRQLPPGALVSPINDASGNPLPGSKQLIPASPHGREDGFDRAHAAPEKYQYNLSVGEYGMNAPAPGEKPFASVAMNRAGETPVTVGAANERDRARPADVGRA